MLRSGTSPSDSGTQSTDSKTQSTGSKTQSTMCKYLISRVVVIYCGFMY